MTPSTNQPAARPNGHLLAARRTAGWVVFGVLPVAIFSWWLLWSMTSSAGDWAFDFHQFWQGGNDVVNGVSPYPSEATLELADDELGPTGIQEVFRFPYPAGAAIALAPLGALDFELAAALWTAVLVCSVVGAVLLLGVRDWRVLGVVVGSTPVIGAVRLGTLTPVLVLLLAVAWRWRDRPLIAGGSLAAAISLKLFLWPLVVWLAATRRYAAAACAALLATLATFAAWAAIGFAGLTDYPELLRRLSDVVADRGFSLVALGVELGPSEEAAGLLPWLVGLTVLAGVLVVARRDGGDVAAFSLAIIAAMALTPIVWLHYFALLVLPLALIRPRLSWAWGLLWIFWLVPAQENEGDAWRVLLAVAVVGAVGILSVRPRGPRLAAAPSSTASTAEIGPP